MQFRTENEILQAAIQHGQNNGLIAEDEEIIERINNGELTNNQYVLSLSTHSYIHADMETIAAAIYSNQNINTATGSALDNFGDLLNVKRHTAQPATAEITISTPSLLEEDIVIPAGTPVILQEFYSSRGYHTLTEVTLTRGMDSIPAVIECDEYGFGMNLPVGSVTGLVGFETLVATNTEKGTHGRNIEEDAEYRERIKDWISINKRGSKECVEDYLDKFPGLDTYYLIPLYDGGGSLKIVCDTIQSNLNLISEGVYKNCMDFTDNKPLCVLPTNKVIQDITLTVNKADDTTISNDELEQLLIAQTRTFIEGGVTRNGSKIVGVGVGNSLYPTQLMRYLANEFLECNNIKLSVVDEVTVEPTEKIKIGTITVVFE